MCSFFFLFFLNPLYQWGNWGAEMKWLAPGLPISRPWHENPISAPSLQTSSFNCTASSCILGTDLFWIETVIKVTSVLVMSFQTWYFRIHFHSPTYPGPTAPSPAPPTHPFRWQTNERGRADAWRGFLGHVLAFLKRTLMNAMPLPRGVP